MENVWACEPEYLKNYLETIINAGIDDKKFEAISDLGSQPKNRLLEINGDVAKITIQGVLSRHGPSFIDMYFGFRGTAYFEIVDAVKAVEADENVKKVILAMDTPGGEAQGVEYVAQAVAQLTSKKEVVAENHGMIASAGYWIASQATRIEAISQIALTGSIGVILVGFDFTKWEDNVGIKQVKIISRNAPKKQADVNTKEGIIELQRLVNSIERVFIAQVANGREISEEKVIKDFGNGGLLIAYDPDSSEADAFTAGLIDHVQMETVKVSKFEGASKIPAEEAVANIDEDESNIIEDDQKPKNEMEISTMTDLIKKLCAEHPELSALVDEKKAESFDAGVASVDARVKKAIPIIESDAYPKPIKALACKVLNGESEAAALEGAVAVFDSTKEEENAAAAAAASGDAGDTPAQQPTKLSEDGEIRNEADYKASLEEHKKGVI